MFSLFFTQGLASIWLMRLVLKVERLSVVWVQPLSLILLLIAGVGSMLLSFDVPIWYACLGWVIALIYAGLSVQRAQRAQNGLMDGVMAVWVFGVFFPSDPLRLHSVSVFWATLVVFSWFVLGCISCLQHRWVERGQWGRESMWPSLTTTLRLYSVSFACMLILLMVSILSGFFQTNSVSFFSSFSLVVVGCGLLISFLFGCYQQWSRVWLWWIHCGCAAVLIAVGFMGHLI